MKVIHKFFVIALLLSLIFSVGAIAATENMTFEQSNMEEVSTETLSASSEEIQEIKSVEDESSLSDAQDSNNLLQHAGDNNQLAAGEGTFAQLQTQITNTAENGTLYLDGKTYVGNGQYIKLSKSITIVGGSSLNDGKYATLDARNLSSIFYANGGYNNLKVSFVFDSIIFINGYTTNTGGAIYSGNNLTIRNCSFMNNYGREGAAIDSSGTRVNFEMYDSYFYNNHGLSSARGGAVDITTDLTTIRNCTFVSNSATEDGGAMHLHGNCFVHDCTFINNTAPKGGALWIFYGSNIINCTFINNTALEGGAIHGLGNIKSISGCKFISNKAKDGGAIYEDAFRMTLENNEFTNNTAEGDSSSVYSNDLLNNKIIYLTGNVVNSDKTEMFFKNGNLVQLEIIVLDNKTFRCAEGKIKLYAVCTDDMGNKFSSDNFTFIIGDREVSTCLKDSYAEAESYVTFEDNGKVVSVNSPISHVYNATLDVILPLPVIDFDNVTDYMGKTVIVPIYVHHTSGQGVEGTINVIYNGNDKTVNLLNGKADVAISLPVLRTTFDLTVQYGEVIETRQVNVIDPDDPVAIVIDMPDSEHGFVGKTLTIPVNVHDGLGKSLKGDITVSYNGQEKTITLIDGQAEILIGLPVYETFFELSVSYKGKSRICLVTVENPQVETYYKINLSHHFFGNIDSVLTVPVKILDEDGNPAKGDINIYYNGQEKTQTLNNGSAGVIITLPGYETTLELIVEYKGNLASCLVEAIDPNNHTSAIINVADKFTGAPGESIRVPISVVDENGNPLNGDVSLSYNGQEKTVSLKNGEANITIGLPVIETSFELVIDYKGHVETCMINVVDPVSHGYSVITMPETLTVDTGRTIIIPVGVHDKDGNPMEGDIAVYYNGFEKSLTLRNGHVNVVVSSQPNPIYFEVTVVYGGVMRSCMVGVIEPKPNLSVEITLPENETGHVSKTIKVPVTVTDKDGNPLDGEVRLYYNGIEREETLHDGHANIIMSLPNNPTSFNLTVSYKGFYKECLINVIPQTDEGIVLPDEIEVVIDLEEEITGNIGKTISIPVSIHDDNGEYLDGDILITYNGHERTITLKEGRANIVVGLTAVPTTFELTVHFEEFIKTSIIKVIDPNDPLNNITDVESDGDGSIVIDLPEDADGKVIVNIGGRNYTGTIINGHVVLDVHDLPNGEYNATVYYITQDNHYSNSTKNIMITINESSDSQNPDSNNVASDSNGNIVFDLPEGTSGVVVNIGGKNYTASIVDGRVVLDVKGLPAGNYSSTVYYLGEGNSTSSKTMVLLIKEYHYSNTHNTIVKPPVAKKTSKIIAKKKTFKRAKRVKKYKITLKSGKTAIKKVKVTIKVGKKTYKAKTNAKGKATFKIKKLTKKGKYTAVIKFKGNKTYKATTKKVKITIK